MYVVESINLVIYFMIDFPYVLPVIIVLSIIIAYFRYVYLMRSDDSIFEFKDNNNPPYSQEDYQEIE